MNKVVLISGALVLAVAIIAVILMMKRSDSPSYTTIGNVVVPTKTSVEPTTQTITDPTTTKPIVVSDTLLANVKFMVGDKLVSKNGKYMVTINSNNQFVISNGNKSGLVFKQYSFPTSSLIVKADGVLNAMNAAGEIKYVSVCTDSCVPGSVLQVSDEGNLCLITPQGTCVWAVNFAQNSAEYPA